MVGVRAVSDEVLSPVDTLVSNDYSVACDFISTLTCTHTDKQSESGGCAASDGAVIWQVSSAGSLRAADQQSLLAACGLLTPTRQPLSICSWLANPGFPGGAAPCGHTSWHLVVGQCVHRINVG